MKNYLGTVVALLWAVVSAAELPVITDIHFSWSPLNRCPAPCSDINTSDTWTTYHSDARLNACQQDMLMDVNIFTPLSDETKHHSIRACTVSSSNSSQPSENIPSQCPAFQQANGTYHFGWQSSRHGESVVSDVDLYSAVEQLYSTIDAKQMACQSRSAMAFARSGNVTVGMFTGGRVQTTSSIVQKLVETLRSTQEPSSLHVQLCEQNAPSDRVFGIWADTSGSLVHAQQAVAAWANATCASSDSNGNSLSIGDIAWTLDSPKTNSTYMNSTYTTLKRQLSPRDDCSTTKVASGDSCASLATKCGVTASDFTTYNPSSSLCSTLTPGQHVCCSAGSMPDFTPKANADGSCASYTVQQDDTCSGIMAQNSIPTVLALSLYNIKTWAWAGCENLQLGLVMCLSLGDPPMPPTVSSALCGPQVPGTTKPTNGTAWADLNPCPLNACCDIWGQCGVTSDFCTATNSSTGNPGTAKAGTNGCISNCGTDIVNNGDSPGTLHSVGYFEAFNANRPCLNMDVRSVDRSSISHVHFAFGTVNSDYTVGIDPNLTTQFNNFKDLAGVNKVVSFGGWSFSTDPSTYSFFRDAVTAANRATLAKNVASFITANSLDGVDFDWEYPGAPDIPGIPAGTPQDGSNYLEFLRLVRMALPTGKTLSIAAPASYWYLKGFPIAKISSQVDYIVYMTYDLHGQWDYNNAYSDPGCPNGNCLRSHVNLTETMTALSMITKAGVPANKIVVGVSSYGRSFKMDNPSCVGPLCTYAGPASQALPGKCTGTAGYISNAEIQDIIKTDPTARTIKDDKSDSDILVYQGNQWVAYMSETTKASRQAKYSGLNFLGSINWAVDLQDYVPTFIPVNQGVSSGNLTKTPWQQATCTNPWITNAALKQSDRWAAVDTDSAWQAAIANWKSGAQGSLTFIEGISNFFHGPEGMQCGTADHAKCDTPMTCTTTNYPAGYFILLSLEQINSMLSNIFVGLNGAQGDMTTQMTAFAKVFTPVPQATATEKIALDLIGLTFALAMAPVWNEGLKASSWFKDAANQLGTIKDQTNGLVSNGITIAKDAMPTDSSNPWTSLEVMMGNLVKTWKTAIDTTTKNLFNGSDTSIASLWLQIQDGRLLQPGAGPTQGDIENFYEKAVLGHLIPMAWSISANDIHPFVLDSGFDCSAVNPLSQYMSDADGTTTGICYNNRIYYLMSATGIASVCKGPPCGATTCKGSKFSVPTGLKALVGTDWAGIKKDDLIIGALASYAANNNQNGWKVADPTNGDTLGALFDHGIQAPGVVTGIPVCSAKTAYAAWDAATSLQQLVAHNVPANYPCNVVKPSKKLALRQWREEMEAEMESVAKRC